MSWDRAVSWNMKVGRDPGTVTDQLQALMKDTEPDVICLQEAGGYLGAIRNRFGHDHGGKWWVYGHSEWDEAGMNPVLVWAKGRDKRTRGKGWDTLRTTTKWTGPQGGTHKGRTFTWVGVDGVDVLSLHRCTDGNGKNKAAFQEEADTLVPWIKAADGPVLVIGDHNCGVGKTHKGASKNIAQDTGSWITAAQESGIDYAIRHGMNGTLKRGKPYGSDHEAVIFNRTP